MREKKVDLKDNIILKNSKGSKIEVLHSNLVLKKICFTVSQEKKRLMRYDL